MKKELTEKEALNKASAYCSKSEHCPSEVNEKLHQWGVTDEEVCQRIIVWLMKESYIDEARFCRSFANDKFRFNRWGKKKIELYLQQKGLPSSFIVEALEEISDEDALQHAIQLMSQKMKSIRTDNPYEVYAKLMRFATGRGIEMKIARQAIKTITDNSPEE